MREINESFSKNYTLQNYTKEKTINDLMPSLTLTDKTWVPGEKFCRIRLHMFLTILLLSEQV